MSKSYAQTLREKYPALMAEPSLAPPSMDLRIQQLRVQQDQQARAARIHRIEQEQELVAMSKLPEVNTVREATLALAHEMEGVAVAAIRTQRENAALLSEEVDLRGKYPLDGNPTFLADRIERNAVASGLMEPVVFTARNKEEQE